MKKGNNSPLLFRSILFIAAVGIIYTPKVIILGFPILPAELIGIFLSVYILIKGIRFTPLLSYFIAYSLIILFSTFYSPLFRYIELPISDIIIATKRTLIGLLFCAGFFLQDHEKKSMPLKLVYLYSLPFLVNLAYLVYNIMGGIDFSRYWIRDPKFQVTLFTSHLIKNGAFTFVGNMGTSVQMGSFCALLSIIFFSLYSTYKKFYFLILHILFIIILIFTISRSGLVSFTVGMIYFLFLERGLFKYIYVTVILSFISITTIYFWDLIGKFGTLAKLPLSTGILLDSSAGHKLYSWSLYFKGLINNPYIFFSGTGYARHRPSTVNGATLFTDGRFTPDQFESLFLDAISYGGILCLVVLSIFWYYLYKTTSYYRYLKGSKNFAIMKGVHAFVPGYFCANLFGNSITTDFFMSFFFILIGILYWDLKASTEYR